MRVLNLGAGPRPEQGATNHDISLHSPWVDTAWDLDEVPWPWDDESWDEVHAFDVMEHLRLDVEQWMDECWRILVPGGRLLLRLPAFDNPLSYRDPTHRKVFHPETLDYWDPDKPLWQDFGRYYFAPARWWRVTFEGREYGDLRFRLEKRCPTT